MKIFFNKSIGTAGYQYGKNNFGLHLTAYTKINLRLIRDLNIKSRPSKLLKENVGKYLHEFGGGKYFIRDTKKLKTN